MLAQRAHAAADPNLFFYVHDRLGSVRMVVAYDGTNETVETVNSYGYTPFGQDYGTPDETVDNPFKFTGQWYDAEISQYYLRARQYDPAMMRFTSRDLIRGKLTEPLTLNKYLYCLNNPTNRIDLNGQFSTTELLITMGNGASMGALGGFSEGLIFELVDWCQGGDFDWGTVGMKTGTGAAFGAISGALQFAKFGTLVNTSNFKKMQMQNFYLGIAQGAFSDFVSSQKGNLGLNEVNAGVAMHNLAIDGMIASMW